MKTIQVELMHYNIEQAFSQAENEAYHEWYSWDMSITLLSTSKMIDSTYDAEHNPIIKSYWLYTFQATKN